jgi:predicted methyltransferase
MPTPPPLSCVPGRTAWRATRRQCLLAGLAASALPVRAQGEADDGLQAALAGSHRSAANRARDAARHPAETLRVFGVQPQHTVVELSPGSGWYTEILAPWLRARGRLVAAHYASDDAKAYRRQSRADFEARLAASPALYDRVAVGTLAVGPGFNGLVAPGSVDQVLTFRNVHNWIEEQRLDALLRAAFEALRPGGVLGVVDHRAAPGTPLAQQIQTGYLTEALVAEHAHAAGFVLEAASEVNANPRDTRDHPHGVWSLPPTLRGGEADRARFLAIGESDRLTHRYRKPRG